MKIKHKLLQDFQFVSSDKKIFVLKSGTILEEYNYKLKSDIIPIDKELVDSNPQFFELIDWKAELMSFMKVNKMPQPAQLGKKLIPFIDEMILSSLSQQTTNTPQIDEFKLKEIEWKEIDLNNREKRIKDKEEEIDIRLKRVEKRESDHKEDLKNLDKKEDELRARSRELTEKQIDVEDKEQELKEKERNFDRSILESSKDLDSKYADLQVKIDKDLKDLKEREKDLDTLSKELKRKKEKLDQQESEISDKIRDFESKKEEFNIYADEIKNLDSEIKSWEEQHWKLKRTSKPPSALD